MGWKQVTWINLLFHTSVYIIEMKLILRKTITKVDFSTFIKQILSLKCTVYYAGITVARFRSWYMRQC